MNIKSGLIKKNEIWSEEIFIESNILIARNIRVTVKPGCKIKFRAKAKDDHGYKDQLLKFEDLSGFSKYWADEEVKKESCFIFVEGVLSCAGEKDNEILIGNKGWEGAIVFLSSERSTVKHCSISHAYYGLYIDLGSSVDVLKNNFKQNKFAIVTKSECLIKENIFESNLMGIYCRQNKNSAIEGNVFTKNKKRGIMLDTVKGSSVSGNVFNSNTAGVDLFNCEMIKIADNELDKDGIGIINNGVMSCEINNNKISNIKNVAILNINAINQLKINKNNIYKGKTGISFENGGENIEINGNLIKGVDYPVIMSGQTHAKLENNQISSAEICVQANGDSQVYLAGNDIKMPAMIGILCNDNSNVIISKNNIESETAIKSCNFSRIKADENDIRAISSGFHCLESSGGVIANNSIEGKSASTTGMEISGETEIVIKGNKIRKVKAGLNLLESVQARIEDINIESTYTGIDARNTGRVDISGSVINSRKGICVRYLLNTNGKIENSRLTGHTGVKLDGTSQLKIDNITVDSIANAIEIGDVGNVDIMNSVISSKLSGCIRYTLNSTGLVENNKLTGYQGVLVEESSNVRVRNNKINIIDLGIKYQQNSGGEISNNEIEGKPDRSIGMKMLGEIDIEIKGNKISSVMGGIKFADGAQARIEGVNIESMDTGIEAADVARVDISGSVINSLKGTCLKYTMNTSGKIENNHLNGYTGVSIDDTSRVDIAGNIFNINKSGIEYRGQSSGTIENNDISGSGQTIGIDINNITEVLIKNNRIKDVSYGIRYSDEAKVGLIRNEVTAKQCIYNEEHAYQNNTIESAAAAKSISPGKNREFLKTARELVLNTWQIPGLRYFYRLFYYLAIYILKQQIGGINKVDRIYLRRGLTFKDWIPGLSDIDFFIVIDELEFNAELDLLKKIDRIYGNFKKIFPFLGEFQIGTDKELEHFYKSGNIRAVESRTNWKLIYGHEEMSMAKEIGNSKYTVISAITELINSYKAMNVIYFNRKKHPESKLSFAKAIIDILRYYMHAIGSGYEFKSRTEVLELYLKGHCPENKKQLITCLKDIWVKNAGATDDLYNQLYTFAIELLDMRLPDITKMISGSNDERKSGEFRNGEIKCMNVVDINNMARWEELSKELIAMSNGYIEGIIFDDPGLLYIIAGNKSYNNTDFLDKVRLIENRVKILEFAKHTPVMVITKNILQAILFSLHLENPFNYFKLLAGTEFDVSNTLWEERWQYGIRRTEFAAPSDELLRKMLEETVDLFNASIRMFAITDYKNKRNEIIYLYNRLLSLHLAIDKKVIAEPFLDNIFYYYKENYPQHAEWIENIKKKYMDRSNYEVEGVPCSQIFEDNYLFFKNLLGEVNKVISTNN